MSAYYLYGVCLDVLFVQPQPSPTAEQKKLYRASMQVTSDLSRNAAPLSPGKRLSTTSSGSVQEKSRGSSGKNMSLISSDNKSAKTRLEEKAPPIRPVPSRDKEREKEEKERRERKEREDQERKERKEREEREVPRHVLSVS